MKRLLLAAVAGLLLFAAGCGDDDEGVPVRTQRPFARRTLTSSESPRLGKEPPRVVAVPPAQPRPRPSVSAPRPSPSASRPRQPAPSPPDLGAFPPSDLPLRLPAPPRLDGALSPALRTLRQQAQQGGTAAGWRALADAAAREGAHALAAEAYRNEARIYRGTGDPNAAQVEELKAAQHASEIALYGRRKATRDDYAGRGGSMSDPPPPARLEPSLGCYVGAFIDRDDSLPQLFFGNQTHGDAAVFGEQTGKRHASHFMYRAYGQPFPSEWARYLKEKGIIPHIAWEPHSLSQVANDAYLRGWVDAARALDWPIFIRFAGEMNGDWTRYHGNPAAYRAAFRLVHRAFRRASQVALMWCPNTIPENGLDTYYPGDDAVDWVGVNFYNVLYLDSDRTRPGDKIHPTDLLEHVYARYSRTKPIAIGEYAATHESKVDGVSRPDFAVEKIAQLYASLPLRYPRVKMVDWYDCNNLVHAQPGRQLNNYLITDLPEIRQAYARAIADPWFLGAGTEQSAVVTVPLTKGEPADGLQAVQGWVRTYVARPRLYFELDGRLVYATRDPAPRPLPTAALGAGAHTLKLHVYDDAGRYVGGATTTLTI